MGTFCYVCPKDIPRGQWQHHIGTHDHQQAENAAPMHDIIVRSHIRGQFLFNVWPHQTILNIKQEVWDMWQIPINRQRLTYGGTRLRYNDRTVLYYALGPGQTVIVQDLRAGGGAESSDDEDDDVSAQQAPGMVRDTPELVQLVQQLGIPAITFQNIPPPATNFYTMQDGLANIYVLDIKPGVQMVYRYDVEIVECHRQKSLTKGGGNDGKKGLLREICYQLVRATFERTIGGNVCKKSIKKSCPK